jgi:hypothetical protein
MQSGRPQEVLTGKAKFGIFGDGKEVAQIAYAAGNSAMVTGGRVTTGIRHS